MISENIKKIMEDNWITMEGFAKTVGTSDTVVCRWVNGQCTPSTKYIIRICEKFKVSADWLLGTEQEKWTAGKTDFWKTSC